MKRFKVGHMIKDLMGKLHIQDSIGEPEKETKGVENVEVGEVKSSVPRPPSPPKMNEEKNLREPKIEHNIDLGGASMSENEGIVIDLGDGISINVPIKKRMSLQEFLSVAEKVKALEMLSEEDEEQN